MYEKDWNACSYRALVILKRGSVNKPEIVKNLIRVFIYNTKVKITLLLGLSDTEIEAPNLSQ